MNDNELKEYIAHAIKEAIADGVEPNTPTPKLLSPTQSKWFKDEGGSVSFSKMGKVFDGQGYKAYRLWDRLRPITLAICGKSYVRQVDPADKDKVNEYADRLCQCVYECRKDWLKYKEKK